MTRLGIVFVSLISAASLLTADRTFAQDAQFKCREAIGKDFAKYVKTLSAAFEKCNDATVAAGEGAIAPGGDFTCGKTQATYDMTVLKLQDEITKACDAAGITAPDISWPPQCPLFEGSPTCGQPFTTTPGPNLAECLDTWRAALAEPMPGRSITRA